MSGRAWFFGLVLAGLLWALVVLAFFAVRAAADPNLAWAPVPTFCTQMTGAPANAWGVYHAGTSRTIEVRQCLCDAIDRAVASHVVNDYAALAVGTIGHEIAHSAGLAADDDADCLAWLIYPSVARFVGFGGREIAAMRPILGVAFRPGCGR